jgi:hypothetical protein
MAAIRAVQIRHKVLIAWSLTFRPLRSDKPLCAFNNDQSSAPGSTYKISAAVPGDQVGGDAEQPGPQVSAFRVVPVAPVVTIIHPSPQAAIVFPRVRQGGAGVADQREFQQRPAGIPSLTAFTRHAATSHSRMVLKCAFWDIIAIWR